MSAGQHHIPELDRTGLREFAFVTSAIIVGLFGLLFPWLFDLGWPVWPWILAAILTILGLVKPLSLRPVYTLWMKLGLVLSKVTTPIILGIVFYLLITPFGLIRKITSRDPMAREFNDEETYRVVNDKAPSKNMERPY